MIHDPHGVTGTRRLGRPDLFVVLDVERKPRKSWVAWEEGGKNGDFPAAPLGLSVGLRPTRYRDHERLFVRWIDAEGKPLPMAQERAERERERARALEDEVRELRKKAGP